MEVELTVRAGSREHDVAVTVDPEATVGDFTAALAATVGATPDALWHNGRQLPPAASFCATGIRSGAVLETTTPATPPRERTRPSLGIVGGPHAGGEFALTRTKLLIGRSEACDVPLPVDVDVSRVHAAVEVQGAGCVLRDLGSTNGTTIDGAPVDVGGERVGRGSYVRVGDSFLTVTDADVTPAVVRREDHALVVNRPPRPAQVPRDDEIVWPAAQPVGAPQRVQLVAAVVPALAGGGLAWFMHSPQFLLFALLSPVVLLSSALGDRVHWRRARRRAARQLRHERAAAQQAVLGALAAETAQRRLSAPDPLRITDMAAVPSSRVWERRRTDEDYLSLRVGLSDQPSRAAIREGTALRPAGICPAVPVTVALRLGSLGVAGPTDALRRVGWWLLAQLCVLHSPADLEVALLLDATTAARWRWARWLPHLRGRVAESAEAWPAVVRDLADVVHSRRARSRRGSPESWPALVIFVDADAARRSETPGLSEVIKDGPSVDVMVVWLGASTAALPSGCMSVVHVDGDAGSRARVSAESRPFQQVILDQVDESWAEQIARALCPLTDVEGDPSAALPPSCRLADVLAMEPTDAAAVQRRWDTASDGAATPVGLASDGAMVLDLVADGPHALLAGTTGAGKSELLQALVVGLAVHHPPEDIAFLLVDYKGGAAFAECARLPHTVGVVTDLDHHLTRRALQSLDAELLRRERLFAAVGATDLQQYRLSALDAGSQPLVAVPRLIIVVDEFAALAEELPEFVQGLVSVAQRGRSLGVHLVLATQRPGSVVSPQIRANASLRIALRVTDVGDSTEVIDSPSAAMIDQRTPGRAFARRGTTLGAFQSVQPGALRKPKTQAAVRVVPLDAWRRRPAGEASAGVTDLATLVETVCQAARDGGRVGHASPWLAPLPLHLDARALSHERPWALPLALVDLPSEQRQDVLQLDLDAARSLLISGGSRSGRSTALATAALTAAGTLAPDELHLYVVDADGGLPFLRRLPHCGTYAGPDETATAGQLIDRLVAQAATRRAHLGGLAVGSPAEARTADRPFPQALLVVDGWEAFTSASDERDGGRSAEAILSLARSGPSAGITVVVSGDRSTLSARVTGAFGQRVVLALADRADFAMAGIATSAVPGALPPGRGLRVDDSAELQIALAADGPSRAEHEAAAQRIADQQRGAGRTARSTAVPPIRLRPLPTSVRLADLPPSAGALTLGVGGDTATAIYWHHGGHASLLVSGPPRSGRTTLLRALLAQARAGGLKPTVVCGPRSMLHSDACRLGAEIVAPDAVLPEHLRSPGDEALLLLDDLETVNDRPLGEQILDLLRDDYAPVVIVAAGRSDEIATTYRGVAAELRRRRCGVLLHPGPADGEILGLRSMRHREPMPPGRGVLLGDETWASSAQSGEPVPVQVAVP